MTNPYQAQIQELEQKIQENQQLISDPELKDLALLEIQKLQKQKKILENAAKNMADAQAAEQESAGGPGSRHCHAILEFRPGTGGDEAKLWAEELMRMYTRFAENLGLRVEFIDESVIKIKGQVSLSKLSDEDQDSEENEIKTAYELLAFESGVHRVQRVPVTESQGRVHTSTATVAVLPEVHPQAVVIRDEDLTWSFMRAGGAGGQSVNKTSSAVRLVHEPSGIVVNARQERKQAQNRQIALELLRSQLWEIQEEARLKEIGQARSSIGGARRSEKIRTYNFPQNRVTDHRIKESWYDLENIVEGSLYQVIKKVLSELDVDES